jgi:hypothetical protein
MAKNDVDKWIENRKPHQVKALEKASKVFDDKDNLSVNTLEAIYGKESSFGKELYLNKSPKGTAKPAGHFQQKKASANEQGLITNPKNDQRFDIDEASIGAAKQLKKLDTYFSKKTKLTNNIFTIGISDNATREIFTIASYNIGQCRIAKAQALAKEASKDPKNWNDVQEFLIPAGANKTQAKEVTQYVTKVLEYKKGFEKKSQANKKSKDKKLKNKASKASKSGNDGHWVTINDKPVLIKS